MLSLLEMTHDQSSIRTHRFSHAKPTTQNSVHTRLTSSKREAPLPLPRPCHSPPSTDHPDEPQALRHARPAGRPPRAQSHRVPRMPPFHTPLSFQPVASRLGPSSRPPMRLRFPANSFPSFPSLALRPACTAPPGKPPVAQLRPCLAWAQNSGRLLPRWAIPHLAPHWFPTKKPHF